MGRRFDELDILAVWIDGIVVDDHHILAAVGVDAEGSKHLLGLAQGSSENAQVAKDLLSSLVERGIGPDRVRLFVIDGSKALRARSRNSSVGRRRCSAAASTRCETSPSGSPSRSPRR